MKGDNDDDDDDDDDGDGVSATTLPMLLQKCVDGS